jgi:hypothetical protein
MQLRIEAQFWIRPNLGESNNSNTNRNHFNRPFNFQRFHGVRQTRMHTPEPLLPVPDTSEAEIVKENFAMTYV